MKKYLFLYLLSGIFSKNIFAQQKADFVTPVHAQHSETVASIMKRAAGVRVKMREMPEREYPERNNLPQNPLSGQTASFPAAANNVQRGGTEGFTDFTEAQTPSLVFNSVTGPTETGAFPPDDMGSVGPTQFITAVNGRIRSFNKTTGAADGVLNVSPDVFFTSVMTPPVASNFTSDPRIRYDRISGRWIIIIIDVPGGTGSTANRCMIAVSNTSTITGSTVWTFSQFLGQTGVFLDYPTLGIDVNALYIGGNMFTLAGAFNGTNGYVISRTALISGSYTVYTFTNLATASGAGPYTPQGVDNFDAAPTEGYFIGVDNATFGTLMMRRVSTPAGVPTISGNISITVSTTASPQPVPHLGNTGGNNGRLDALDDRCYAAMARGGHLWTAHNISVNESGVATSSGTTRRNGCRWYDLQNLTTTPTVSQSGTIFDPAVTASNPRWYSIPTVMVSGQGHAAFSLTTGGNNDRSNAATAGRWSSDAAGTTQAPVLTTSSSTAYNPSGDAGSASGRRWGDYSYVSLDPIDNMTMWMIAQYCSGTNVYGCSVAKLLAPPPATPASCSPNVVNTGQSSVNVVVTATSSNSSGFYDPGANLAAPAQPYNHIAATVSGGVIVNSVTYTDPTHITLNINTTAASVGFQTITVTNPDGQTITSAAILNIVLNPVAVNLLSFNAKKAARTVDLSWTTAQELNNSGFEIQKSASGNFSGGDYNVLSFVNAAGINGQGADYHYTDVSPLKGRNYYRLKQVDLNAAYHLSEIRIVDFDDDNSVAIYPNPFSGILTVSNVPDKTDFRIVNTEGKVVMKGKLNNNTINTSRLLRGVYFIEIIQASGVISKKMEKK